jgi:cell division septation protein DedD
MITPEIQATTTAATAPSAATTPSVPGHTTAAGHPFTFHDLLSAMNPLQYLPVVGTIYRAVTGDVIPEPARDAGSMLVSGLLGGPIGLVTYVATAIAEKVTGIDPEKIIAAELHGSHPADATPATPTAAAAATPAMPTAVTASAPAASASPAWTQKQLAAYGVRSDASGALRQGDLEGADVLNNLELVRLNQAAAAYAANQSTPLTVAARSPHAES